MAADNHTTIVGNLVDDPELRFTNNGIAVANLRWLIAAGIRDFQAMLEELDKLQSDLPSDAPAPDESTPDD